MTEAPRLPPVPFAEAIAWARGQRVVLPPTYYGEIAALVRAQAFTVSGLATLDQISAVHGHLVAALEEGQTFRQWQTAVLAEPGVPDLGPHALETVWRNNIQQAYNRGRYAQQAGSVASQPFYMYDAVNDSRTRPTHAAMDGHVARHDDPVWQTWSPACGHRCRCRRIALSPAQAAARAARDAERLTDPQRAAARALAISTGPDNGWGYDPYLDPTAGLRGAIERRAATATAAEAPALEEMRARLAATSGARAFEPQRTAKAAAKYAVRANLADFADYTGVSADAANAWNQSLHWHLERYPLLRPAQQYTGTTEGWYRRIGQIKKAAYAERLAQADIPPARAAEIVKREARKMGWGRVPKLSDEVWAQSHNKGLATGITLHQASGAAAGDLIEDLARTVARGYHPPGCASIKAIVDHELAHQLDDLVRASDDPSVAALWGQGADAVAREVSAYAALDIREMVAEGWAEYLNHATPRPWARTIGETIERRYRELPAAGG